MDVRKKRYKNNNLTRHLSTRNFGKIEGKFHILCLRRNNFFFWFTENKNQNPFPLGLDGMFL